MRLISSLLILLVKSISILFITIFVLLTFFISPSFAKTVTRPSSTLNTDSSYTINELDTTTNVSKKNVNVVEKFQVTFNSERHGLLRYIPQVYQYYSSDQTLNRSSRINIVINSITDENNNNIEFSQTVEKLSIVNTRNIIDGLFYNVLVIKIGNPNYLISGDKTYNLNYSLDNFPETNPQFEYNILGTGWSNNILKYVGTINFNEDPIAFECFVGEALTDSQNLCNIQKNTSKSFTITESNVGNNTGIQIRTQNQNFTPNQSELVQFLTLYWYVFIPPLLLLFLLLYWYLTQRAPKGTGVVVPQFSIPDDLRPAEVGSMNDDTIKKVDVSATIIDLAIRGYLKIKNISNDPKTPKFLISLLKDTQDDLKPFEKTLVLGIFSSSKDVYIEDLSQSFMVGVYSNIEEQIYISEIQQGYYKSKPQKPLSIVYSIILSITLAFPAIIFSLTSIGIGIFIAIFSFIVSLPFFYFRNYKTQKGIIEKEKIQGLKLFIEYAKKDQLQMLQTPYTNQELFEKCLPYAMVFGLHSSWAKAFEGINISNPPWYEDQNGIGMSMWNVIYFTSFINIFSDSMNTAFSLPTSETGSGFLGGVEGGDMGGGFSGGGGGSW